MLDTTPTLTKRRNNASFRGALFLLHKSRREASPLKLPLFLAGREVTKLEYADFLCLAWLACELVCPGCAHWLFPHVVGKRGYEAFGVPSLPPGTVFDASYRCLLHGTSKTLPCFHTSPRILSDGVSGDGEVLRKEALKQCVYGRVHPTRHRVNGMEEICAHSTSYLILPSASLTGPNFQDLHTQL